MKILAIDSSSAPASVAVCENGVVIGEFTININRTHSEKLLPMVDMLLETLNITAKDIDAFAISRGPGSFTGLRIGMSVAKLMAQVNGKPLIAVDTLMGLAGNVALFDSVIIPVLDARNNTVFTAIYEYKDGNLNETATADAVSVTELAEKIDNIKSKVIICGEFGKYKVALTKENVIFAPANTATQKAGTVALIAEKLYEGGVRTVPEEVVPFYVRESQAEQAKRAKEGKNG